MITGVSKIENSNEINLYKFGLPLSIHSHISAIALSTLPYLVIYFTSDNYLIKEGLLIFPAIITYLLVRHRLIGNEHQYIDPIRVINQSIAIPGNLHKEKIEKRYAFDSLLPIQLTYSQSRGKTYLSSMRISDKFGNSSTVSIYQADLQKLLQLIRKNNLQTTNKKSYYIWSKITLILNLIVAIITFLIIGITVYLRNMQ